MFALKQIKDILTDNRITVSMENNEEIISKLKFIGYIQKNQRFNSRFFTIQQSDSLFTKISRTLIYPDNRNNALMCIRHVISRSFEIIDSMILKNNILESKQIINDMIKAQEGMINIKYTYRDDTKFCCDMDVLIQKISVNLQHLQNKHKELFVVDEDNI